MWVILAGQRLDLLLRHPVAVTGLINLALATTAPSAADGKAAFAGALAANLAPAFPGHPFHPERVIPPPPLAA